MKLPTLISDYLAYRHALGYRLIGEAFMLRAFSNSVGGNSVSALTVDQVRTYLCHGAVSPQTVAKRYRALSGFYRYLVTRHGIHLPALPPCPEGGQDHVRSVYLLPRGTRAAASGRICCLPKSLGAFG